MADLVKMADLFLIIHIIFIKMTMAVFKAQNFAVQIHVKMADLFLVIHIIFIKMTMTVKMASFAETEIKQNKTKQMPFLRNFEILFLT